MVAASGEPLVPAFADLLRVYNAKALAASEVMQVNPSIVHLKTERLTGPTQLNLKMRAFKILFANAWDATKNSTSSGRTIDALVCPVAPSAGIPHDFNIYWGYTSMWNILDYPSTVLPIPHFKINARDDPPNPDYEPLTTNPYDAANHTMCKSSVN